MTRILSAAACLGRIVGHEMWNCLPLFIWLALMLVAYCAYGVRDSKLAARGRD